MNHQEIAGAPATTWENIALPPGVTWAQPVAMGFAPLLTLLDACKAQLNKPFWELDDPRLVLAGFVALVPVEAPLLLARGLAVAGFHKVAHDFVDMAQARLLEQPPFEREARLGDRHGAGTPEKTSWWKSRSPKRSNGHVMMNARPTTLSMGTKPLPG